MIGTFLNESDIQAAKDMLTTAGFTNNGVVYEYKQQGWKGTETFSVSFGERTTITHNYTNLYGKNESESETFCGWPNWPEQRSKLCQLRNILQHMRCGAKFPKLWNN